MSKRVLLLGARGQLGRELLHALQPLGVVTALDRQALDLADLDAVRRVVRAHPADVIVNAAAYTAVDRAESEPELAHAINHLAPGVLAAEAAASGAVLVHYSTDYVYDGARPLDGPAYVETDATAPLNVYGQSKLAGDLAIVASGAAHLIFRTSWVYGATGGNFMATMRALMTERTSLSVVADQWGAPTPARQIALVTALALQQVWGRRPQQPALQSTPSTQAPTPNLALPSGTVPAAPPPWGVYHVQAAGVTSWFEWASLLHAAWLERGVPLRCTAVQAVPSSAWASAARRPLNSRLDCCKLKTVFGLALPDWQTLLLPYLGD